MRRTALLLAGFVFSVCAFAQEAETATPEAADPWLVWKWVNVLILAAGIGYLIWKMGGAFYRSRTELIAKGISEAAKLKSEAEARAAEIEAKLAGLAAEAERMKTTAKEEFALEGRRIEQETARLAERIRQETQQEISVATKHVIAELKGYAAKLALDLAEGQVRSSMTPEIDHGLVNSFSQGLGAVNR